MRTVWKYTLSDLTQKQELTLPCGSQPLCVRFQNDMPAAWVLVNPEQKEKETWTFWTIMTGQDFDKQDFDKPWRPALHYLGTVVLENGIVLHYFATRDERPRNILLGVEERAA